MSEHIVKLTSQEKVTVAASQIAKIMSNQQATDKEKTIVIKNVLRAFGVTFEEILAKIREAEDDNRIQR